MNHAEALDIAMRTTPDFASLTADERIALVKKIKDAAHAEHKIESEFSDMYHRTHVICECGMDNYASNAADAHAGHELHVKDAAPALAEFPTVSVVMVKWHHVDVSGYNPKDVEWEPLSVGYNRADAERLARNAIEQFTDKHHEFVVIDCAPIPF